MMMMEKLCKWDPKRDKYCPLCLFLLDLNYPYYDHLLKCILEYPNNISFQNYLKLNA